MFSLERKDNIYIYPNPTSGEFGIYNLQSTNYDLSLYTILGEKVYFTQIVNLTANDIDRTTNIVNINLPDGVYFLQLKTEQGIMSKKIIINK